jgi:hypothetical protein
MILKNAVFWDVASCRSCVIRHFGGTYGLHLQGRKIRERGTSVSRWLQIFYCRPQNLKFLKFIKDLLVIIIFLVCLHFDDET